MHVLSYQVRNVLRIADLDLNMEGRNLVLVGGANGHGKTSALVALLMALCGKSGMDYPDISLKEGEDEGSVTVKLSGTEEMHEDEFLTVELMLRRKRGGVIAEEFRVLDSTGAEAPEPRKTLKRLYEMRGFDPLDFERSKPKDRAELLRKLVGLDFTELDRERAEVYAERTGVNSLGKGSKAEMESIDVPEGTPDKALNASELFDQLEQAKKNNTNWRTSGTVLKKMVDMEGKLGEEEARLKARLLQIDEERQQLDAEIDRQEKLCEALQDVDTDEIEDKIRSVDKVNAAVAKKVRREVLSKSVSELRAKSQELSDRIVAIDALKQRRLENAEWPLEGLSLDDAGVLLDGLPFEQASKAQRVMASVNIGMALNPKLRLLVCQDGNDLDNETLSALETALKKNDFQMLLEFVTRSEEDEARCAVVFYEGRPKGVVSEPEAVASEA